MKQKINKDNKAITFLSKISRSIETMLKFTLLDARRPLILKNCDYK